ncbi:MAG: CDP-glycerol glycerophosphotransferase family protein [Proteobacteria bacterium]|nr:CDP-glycerol glycerophosphotransferase family protein [Pseudomonadota bacterium]
MDRRRRSRAMTAGRSVAIAFYPHHVEHLAPVCGMFDAPLLACDAPDMIAAVACYPGLDVRWMRGVGEHSPVRAIGQALRGLAPDVVYYSHLAGRPLLRNLFADGRGAPPRIVHCPHGFSEKRQDWAREVAFQDVALLPGRHALDQLVEFGVAPLLAYYVIGGNLRKLHYEAHRAFFDAVAARHGVVRDPARHTVLYAPTWNDRIGSSSLFAALEPLVRDLPAGHRLLVKPHPLSDRDAGTRARIDALCGGRRDVVVLRDCPLTMPFLALADSYVGDMSSLAYDYLAWQRPMVFLNQTAGSAADAAGSRLLACGMALAPANYGDVHAALARAAAVHATTHAAAQAALYAYTYEPGRSVADVRAALADVTSGPAPTWMDPRWAPRAAPARQDAGLG